MTKSAPLFRFDNSYMNQLDGFYSASQPDHVPDPRFIHFNHSLAQQLDLDVPSLSGQEGVHIFSGNTQTDGAAYIAQAYAGHQFGGFSPQLGDGRALLLGEIIDCKGKRRDIQLKGSGRTVFSRGGDGKSALGPVLREYLVAEAMHAMGVSTTRALAAVTTGEYVMREQRQPGAILTRVASSHIRIGTFQFFSARGQTEQVKKLADYTIARHYPEIAQHTEPYLQLIRAVASAQAKLVSQWMQVGFVHGVMNTDNMTISGETIDYGPCAFLDHYDPHACFSSIDKQGRYAYDQQADIAAWNLARFAETLLPLIHDDQKYAIDAATEVIASFDAMFKTYWLNGMRAKLGLGTTNENDSGLVNELLDIMHKNHIDFTHMFRNLTDAAIGDNTSTLALFNNPESIAHWLEKWKKRSELEDLSGQKQALKMNNVNPVYIPRNHIMEEVIEAATSSNDFTAFETFLKVLEKPYDKIKGYEKYAQHPPDSFGSYTTFCGT